MTPSEPRCARPGCGDLKSQHHGAMGRTCGPPEPCYGPPSYVTGSGYGCEVNCPAFLPPPPRAEKKEG
ncbi:MAG TPA: hypothetical protein VGG32_10540 [Thermoplasmata archaeon]